MTQSCQTPAWINESKGQGADSIQPIRKPADRSAGFLRNEMRLGSFLDSLAHLLVDA
jgi:hypothetical protein